MRGVCKPGGIDDNKSAGDSGCNKCGNPVNAGSGNKYQLEADYGNPGQIMFERYYNGKGGSTARLGVNWTGGYDRSISTSAGSWAAVMRDSGKSLQRILDDTLDFSKVEAGKLEVRPEPASVARVVEGVFNLYSGNAAFKNLKFSCHTSASISPWLLVDPLRLRVALPHLVSTSARRRSSCTT